jgi:hypothetical protein
LVCACTWADKRSAAVIATSVFPIMQFLPQFTIREQEARRAGSD